MSMQADPPPNVPRPAADWGGFAVRFAAWLLVFACVFAMFYGLTSQPEQRSLRPFTVPEGASHPAMPEPAGSMPMPKEQRYRYSV